jgi:hypothetical protein
MGTSERKRLMKPHGIRGFLETLNTRYTMNQKHQLGFGPEIPGDDLLLSHTRSLFSSPWE